MLTLIRRPQATPTYHWSEGKGTVATANVLEYVESPTIGQSYAGADATIAWTIALRTTYDGSDPAYAFDSQTGRVTVGVEGGNGFHAGGTWQDVELFPADNTERIYMIVSDGASIQAYRNNIAVGSPLAEATDIGGTDIAWRSHYAFDTTAPWLDAVPRGAVYNLALTDAQRNRVGRIMLDRAVFFGDSITFGLNASDAAHRWVNLVAAERGWTNFINAGISGSHLQNSPDLTGAPFPDNARDTYQSRVLDYFPNYVFIMYGMNDFRYDDPDFTAANYQNDLGELVDIFVADGVDADNIVIGTIPYVPSSTYTANPPDYDGGTLAIHLAYNAAAEAIATGRGTRFADIYTAMLLNGGDALVSDGVHPTDSGHAVIANAFLGALD